MLNMKADRSILSDDGNAHAAPLGAALAKKPKLAWQPVVQGWVEHGWGQERFRRELAKATHPTRGRRSTGVRFIGQSVAVNLETFDLSALSAADRRKVREFAERLWTAVRGG